MGVKQASLEPINVDLIALLNSSVKYGFPLLIQVEKKKTGKDGAQPTHDYNLR